MAEFKPVVLVSKDGDEYVATTAREFNNLASQGYARKNVKSKVSIPAPATPAAEPEVPVEEPTAARKPVRTSQASK